MLADAEFVGVAGVAGRLASSLQEDTNTNPKLTAAIAEHSMLQALETLRDTGTVKYLQ